MKKSIVVFAAAGALLASGQSWIYNPPSGFIRQSGGVATNLTVAGHIGSYGFYSPGTEEGLYTFGAEAGRASQQTYTVCIGTLAGANNAWDGNGEPTNAPAGGHNCWVGTEAGTSSISTWSFGFGLYAGMVASGHACTYIGQGAGRASANNTSCVFIGKYAGYGAYDLTDTLIIDHWDDSQQTYHNPSDAMLYFTAEDAALSLGRPEGTLTVRGVNVVKGSVITNFVQQKDVNGFVTNIIAQSVLAKIIKE